MDTRPTSLALALLMACLLSWSLGGCGGDARAAGGGDSEDDGSDGDAQGGDGDGNPGGDGDGDASGGGAGSGSESGGETGGGPMGLDHQLVPSSREVELPDLAGAVFPEPGATQFETAVELPDGEVLAGARSRSSGNMAGVSTTAGAPAAAQPTDDAAGASDGTIGADPAAQGQGAAQPVSAEREIVEADVVQMDGDLLYVLNRYRGLVLIDMSDPDSPYVIGRLPFQAQPVDMYLRDGRAYVVMSDYFTYYQWDDDADPLGFHGSRVLVVDVSDPTKPAEAGSFNVDGEVTDTRIVGDVLYAVSSRNPQYWRYDTYDWEDTTWVVSIDISDAADIHEVDRVEFSGASNLIQVYSTALSVAAVDPNYYLVDADNARETLVTFVDISDPGGKIHVGDGAYVEGVVADKFKMDYDGGYLRVISQDWYWNQNTPAQLYVFDARDADELKQVAKIPVAGDVPGTTTYTRPQATRFSNDKLFVSLCWSEQRVSYWVPVCRLDLYDLAAPDSPSKAGELSIDGGISHFEVRGDRLIALGNHNIQSGTSWTTKVQVALYDITTLADTTLLSSTDLGDLSSSTNAAADYKAFKLFEDLNMILLPLSWTEPAPLPARQLYKNGAQIVDWVDDTVRARGRIEHYDTVERVIAFQDRVVVVSPRQLQVVDAADRDAPATTARMFLVRNVVDVFDVQGYQVQLGYDEEDSSFRFFVLPFGDDDMDDSIAELAVDGSMVYRLRSGDIIRMIGYDYALQKQVIRNADFSDPENPRWRGEYVMPDEIQHVWNGGGYYFGGYRGYYGGYGYWGYYDWYWNPSVGQPLENDYLPATVREVKTDMSGRRFYVNNLQLIDLTDPDNPRLASGKVEMPDHPFVNQVTHGSILYSTHTEPALDEDGHEKQYHVRYFLDRVDASDPDDLVDLGKLNIPGRLVDVDESGEVIYTVDYQWDMYGRRRNSINVLHLEDDRAVLKAVLPVGDEIGRARYNDREIWLASHKYPWWGRSAETPDSRQPYTRLSRVRIAEDGPIDSLEYLDIWGYHFNLLDVDGDQAFLSSSYPTGLMVIDSQDLANAQIVTAARTIGYVSKIVRHDDFLYMPMGPYGVRRVAF